ncbi:MAG TPA: outer membrane beta-barrel domain-containing protein [Polyangiaceae bacterium]|jgi:outer membrane beta-barrel protein|nr:outer membrane beta-barrel domain-containing protein [Polyangiaceae bacterium]
MKSSPIGLLVAVALGIFPAQSWAAGKGQAAGKAAAAKDPKGAADSAAAGADAAPADATPPAGGDAAAAGDAAADTGGGDDDNNAVPGGSGLEDICKIDPAACPNLDMDKEAARPLKEQIFAVQQAYALRVRRLELQGGWSVSMNDQFVGHPAPVLALNYYITNVLAIGLNGEYYAPFNVDQQFNAEVRRAARVAVPLTEYQWGAALNFTYVPAYGKFAGFGDFIFHYDAYVVGGVGAISVRPIPVIDPDNRNFAFQPKLAFNAGIGLRIFFNRWFAAVLEVRDYVFNDKLENLTASSDPVVAQNPATWYGETSLTNNVQAQIGAAIFLPFSFDYRLPK